MEQKPLLQRRQRQHILNRRILPLKPLNHPLRQRHQRQIARAATTSPRSLRMPHKRLQRSKPTLRQIADLLLRHKRRRPGPVRHQLRSLRLIKRQRIDLNAVRQRHARIAAPAKPHRFGRTSPVPRRSRRKPPKIVEADLRRRKPGKLRARLRVQIAQQSVAKAVVRHRTQLLLDLLQRAPKRGTPAQSLLDINRPRFQPHREQAGEPTHRARKVHIRKNLLAPVALNIDQHRIAAPPITPPTPLRNRQRKRGQKHMVDAGMERRRYPPQQPLRQRSRKRQRQPPRRAHHVASRIQRAVKEQQRRLAQHPSPKRQLLNTARGLRPRRKPLRPATKRGATRPQHRHIPPRNRLPRSRKLRHQNAPRHSVHTQMMNHHKQTPRMLRTSIEPNRLHHHPRRRRKSALRRLRLLANARLPRRCIKTTNVNPPNALSRNHRSRRRHLKLPLPPPSSRIHPQTQRIVVIKHSLQRTDQIILAHSRRNLQQHRLVKPIDPTTTLQQPAHDRRRHHAPSGDVRQWCRRRLDQRRYTSQPRYRLMLKHRSGRNHQARFAGPAHQLDRDNAVAPKREEVVLNPNPRDPQYLRKQRTQNLLLRRARQTSPTPPPILRRRQRAAVQLPVRRQRKPIKLNNRCRNHVLRQPQTNMRAQRRRI